MKQIRQFAHSDGLVVLTNHARPALIVMEVERCLQLLDVAKQRAQLLPVSNPVEFAQDVSVADATGLSK